ncbi:MAG: hypothetical protein EDM78_13320, partial [Proteobacteria bacterium]
MPLGEFELIARYFDRGPAREAILGIGDDCALLAPAQPHCVTAVSTDMLLAGRHFLADDDPATVGHKALAVNLSDLAAMGARPSAFTLALAVPVAPISFSSSATFAQSAPLRDAISTLAPAISQWATLRASRLAMMAAVWRARRTPSATESAMRVLITSYHVTPGS